MNRVNNWISDGTSMRSLKIVLNMLHNRFFCRDPDLADTERPSLDRLVFVLNFFPPYNVSCWLWAKISARWLPRSMTAARISHFLMRRGFLFGGLRHLSPEDKNAFAQKVVLPPLKAAHPVPPIPPLAKSLAHRLAETGFVSFGSLVSRDAAESAVHYFRQQRGYTSQTPLTSDGVLRLFDAYVLQGQTSERYFSYSSKISLGCPQVANVVNHPLLREVAAAYLGFTPILFSINTLVTTEGDADHYVMRMHRDYDAFASVTFFVYWTDVSERNGATIYVPGSHVSAAVSQAERVHLTGRAGQVFGLDTFGLHAGNRSVEGFRVATWCRFGAAPNLSTVQSPELVPTSVNTSFGESEVRVV